MPGRRACFAKFVPVPQNQPVTEVGEVWRETIDNMGFNRIQII